MSSPLDIVKAYQDAWIGGDFERSRHYLSPAISFRSPQHDLTGISDFLAMLTTFGQRIEQRWELVSAVAEDGDVFILYRLFTARGEPALCADHFTVDDGRITSETLVFDPEPFAAAAHKAA
ncbi:MAG TPA: nuclear transport factor 2 family protein [Thermoleophilia bacterium]|nr:nuclear transport factor 2 family protein [Thermoleophilia bacterium]